MVTSIKEQNIYGKKEQHILIIQTQKSYQVSFHCDHLQIVVF